MHAWLDRPSVVQDLKTYFGVGRPADEMPPVTGGWFEAIDGGGDRPAVADVITAVDVLAVGALSVAIPAPAALDLVDGPVGRRLAALLPQIPVGVDLAGSEVLVVSDDGAAADFWRTVQELKGVGSVTAGKLLARSGPP
nr:DUF6308 family protein [Kineococcus siccus]